VGIHVIEARGSDDPIDHPGAKPRLELLLPVEWDHTNTWSPSTHDDREILTPRPLGIEASYREIKCVGDSDEVGE
jgi:hypothetical protein